MDRSVKPGNDFFEYVNGIPADQTRYGAFNMLIDLSEAQVRAIVERWKADQKLAPDTDEAKVAALYRTFLDDGAAECAQYEAFAFPQLPGSHITGRQTMGENIADLGGVLLGLEAYRLSLGGKPAPVIDGFTGDQRVFLGWGQVWRTLFRDDALRQYLATDSHSPGMVRAFAPLRNVDAWYDAFGVKQGDANYVKPEERVRIW
jgi:predicted metalloendopeptidase